MSWQPGASHETLQRRAMMLAAIRDYFKQQAVLEVETAALSAAGNCDPAIDSFVSTAGKQRKYYLHTSPELQMKRLLAAGSGSIYQICKAFRREESGRYHNPEFSLLEWYRIGFDHHRLMDDVEALVTILLSRQPVFKRVTYRQLFVDHVGLDPLAASDAQLLEKAATCDVVLPAVCERDWLLAVLFDHAAGDYLQQAGAVFVYDYPASQAALACLHKDDPRLAERFELYIDGVELANGFHELIDGEEQRSRFAADIAYRQRRDMCVPPQDNLFLQALDAGMPKCAGVALGLDRLLMLVCDKAHIDEVITFPVDRA